MEVVVHLLRVFVYVNLASRELNVATVVRLVSMDRTVRRHVGVICLVVFVAL